MKETPQQYSQRILGFAGSQDPARVLAATPKKLSSLLRGLTPAMRRKRPAPGKWSISEIVAHLSETELVVGWRIRFILEKSGSPIQAMDQDIWARNSRYEKMDIRLALDAFRAQRAVNLRLLKLLTPEMKARYGMHSERGKESVAHIARLYAGHDLNHLSQIEGIRNLSKGALRRSPLNPARSRE